jgi:hypothetical protein
MLLHTEKIKVCLLLFLDFYIAYSKSYSSLSVKVALFGYSTLGSIISCLALHLQCCVYYVTLCINWNYMKVIKLCKIVLKFLKCLKKNYLVCLELGLFIFDYRLSSILILIMAIRFFCFYLYFFILLGFACCLSCHASSISMLHQCWILSGRFSVRKRIIIKFCFIYGLLYVHV